MKKLALVSIMSVFMILGFSMSASAAVPTPTGAYAAAFETQVDIFWNPVTGAEGYNVYKDGVKHNTSLITNASYTVTGLTAATAYVFTIKAYDEGDLSESPPATLNVTTDGVGTGSDMNTSSFVATARGTTQLVKSGIGVFLEPPLVWFVALGGVAAGVGIASKLIPRKKAANGSRRSSGKRRKAA